MTEAERKLIDYALIYTKTPIQDRGRNDFDQLCGLAHSVRTARSRTLPIQDAMKAAKKIVLVLDKYPSDLPQEAVEVLTELIAVALTASDVKVEAEDWKLIDSAPIDPPGPTHWKHLPAQSTASAKATK